MSLARGYETFEGRDIKKGLKLRLVSNRSSEKPIKLTL
jgi:hypothetical protein